MLILLFIRFLSDNSKASCFYYTPLALNLSLLGSSCLSSIECKHPRCAKARRGAGTKVSRRSFRFPYTNLLSIGRPKDKKNNNSILLQEVLEPYYIYKVDKKTNIDTNVDTNVNLKLLPYSYLINI